MIYAGQIRFSFDFYRSELAFIGYDLSVVEKVPDIIWTKIGWTKNTADIRNKGAHTFNALRGLYEVIAEIPGEEADEKAIHTFLYRERMWGEWFRDSERTRSICKMMRDNNLRIPKEDLTLIEPASQNIGSFSKQALEYSTALSLRLLNTTDSFVNLSFLKP